MNDTPADSPNAQPESDATAGPSAAIIVNAQYTKDLSFESPSSPAIFGLLQENQPDINIDINVGANNLRDNLFEVVLEIRATCTIKEQSAFIAELAYAGVFTLNVDQEHLGPVLMIECPRLLFPFARNIIADVSREGGFPPVMLGLVDFPALYQQSLERMQNKDSEDSATKDA